MSQYLQYLEFSIDETEETKYQKTLKIIEAQIKVVQDDISQ